MRPREYREGRSGYTVSSGAATPKYLIDAVASAGIRRSSRRSRRTTGDDWTTCVAGYTSSHVSRGHLSVQRAGDSLEDSCFHPLPRAFLIDPDEATTDSD